MFFSNLTEKTAKLSMEDTGFAAPLVIVLASHPQRKGMSFSETALKEPGSLFLKCFIN